MLPRGYWGALSSCRFGEGTESRGPERLTFRYDGFLFRQTFCNAWKKQAEVVFIYRLILFYVVLKVYNREESSAVVSALPQKERPDQVPTFCACA